MKIIIRTEPFKTFLGSVLYVFFTYLIIFFLSKYLSITTSEIELSLKERGSFAKLTDKVSAANVGINLKKVNRISVLITVPCQNEQCEEIIDFSSFRINGVRAHNIKKSTNLDTKIRAYSFDVNSTQTGDKIFFYTRSLNLPNITIGFFNADSDKAIATLEYENSRLKWVDDSKGVLNLVDYSLNDVDSAKLQKRRLLTLISDMSISLLNALFLFCKRYTLVFLLSLVLFPFTQLASKIWRNNNFQFLKLKSSKNWLYFNKETIPVYPFAILSLCLCLYVSYFVYKGMPHVQDETSYLIAAKAISNNSLDIEVPKGLSDVFELPPFVRSVNSKLSPYWPGTFQLFYPSLLSIFYRANIEWMFNPILGSALIFLVYCYVRNVYGYFAALISIYFLALSPFSILTFSSLMATTITSVLVNITAFLLWFAMKKNNNKLYLLSSFVLGLCLNCRLFDGFLAGVFYVLVSLMFLLNQGREKFFRLVKYSLIGISPALFLLFWQSYSLSLFNGVQSGGILNNFKDLFLGDYDRVVSLNRLIFAWSKEDAFSLLIFGYLALFFNRRYSYIIALSLLFPIGYVFFSWHGIMYGPRYWYPSFPAMIIVFSLAITRIFSITSNSLFLEKKSILNLLLSFYVIVPFFDPNYLKTIRDYSDEVELRADYNGFDASFIELVKELNIGKSIVFLSKTLPWQNSYTALYENIKNNFDGPIVWISDFDRNYEKIKTFYHDRSFYLLSKEFGELKLYELMDIKGNLSFVEANSFTAKYGKNNKESINKQNIIEGLTYDGFVSPLFGGMQVSSKGRIYTSLSLTRSVISWKESGLLDKFYGNNLPEDDLGILIPGGIGIDKNENVYIGDKGKSKILVYNNLGEYIKTYDQTLNGRLIDKVFNFSVSANQDLLLLEPMQRTLTLFREDGLVSKYCPDLDLVEPIAICSNDSDRFYIIDKIASGFSLIENCERKNTFKFQINDCEDFGCYKCTVDASNLYMSSRKEKKIIKLSLENGSHSIKPINSYPLELSNYKNQLYYISDTNSQLVKIEK